ncbi:DUF6148 family protein [Psychrilyobacter sp.]|uniref:DUF6148 family protein n=1 Tax=Psychrilyobacter sp. TaxID=2586924 RepID=UPI0030159DBA
MIFTLEEAQAKLKLWMEAEDTVAMGGKRYKIGKRELERADLNLISKRIEYWKRMILQIKRGTSGPRSVSVVLRDL